MKLPPININKIKTDYTLSIPEYWQKHERHISELFKQHTTEYDIIQTHLEKLDLLYLGSREIKFKCNCSRERMVRGLWSIAKTSGLDQLFLPGETEIETKCDYCKTSYLILKDEFVTH
jgi:molecular chaperone Hsp33